MQSFFIFVIATGVCDTAPIPFRIYARIIVPLLSLSSLFSFCSAPRNATPFENSRNRRLSSLFTAIRETQLLSIRFRSWHAGLLVPFTSLSFDLHPAPPLSPGLAVCLSETFFVSYKTSRTPTPVFEALPRERLRDSYKIVENNLVKVNFRKRGKW